MASQSNDGKRHEVLMHRAARGDHKAAESLLRGQWYPGDPDSLSAQDAVISYAQTMGYGGEE